jgi:predicted aspartyl protease
MRMPWMRSNNVQISGVFAIGICLGAVLGAAAADARGYSAPKLGVSSQNLDRLIERKRYSEFERQLPSANLSENERRYFEGVLADRLNQPSHAIELLEKALPELTKLDRKRAAIALYALAEDYFMVGRYSEATAQYAVLLEDFGRFLDEAERRTAQDNHDTFALLGNATPQSISGERSAKLTTRRDPLGDLEVPVKVGANNEWWIWDTGANISTITKSTAKRLGLIVSKGHAQTLGGATGTEVSLSTAVIPELIFGGAVVHNVVVLVMDDKELNINLGTQGAYQIDGILGYPVLAAMQTFTVDRSEMHVGVSKSASARTTRLYVDEMTPLVAASSGSESLIFQFDTGNSGADLTARFLKSFPKMFASLKSERGQFGGAGGTKSVTIYRLPELELSFGSATAKFKKITLFDGDRGELLDKLFGNLGQGLLNQFQSYTVDFTRMQVIFGEPASK